MVPTWLLHLGRKRRVVAQDQRDDKPCAHRISYNEERHQFRDQNRNLCQYTGEWDDQGDLLVTIGGTAYRAVEILIDGPP